MTAAAVAATAASPPSDNRKASRPPCTFSTKLQVLGHVKFSTETVRLMAAGLPEAKMHHNSLRIVANAAAGPTVFWFTSHIAGSPTEGSPRGVGG